MNKTAIINEIEIKLIAIKEQKQKSIENISNILEKINEIGNKHDITYRFRLKDVEEEDEYIYTGIGLPNIHIMPSDEKFSPFDIPVGNSMAGWQKWNFEYIERLENCLIQALPDVLKELNRYIKK